MGLDIFLSNEPQNCNRCLKKSEEKYALAECFCRHCEEHLPYESCSVLCLCSLPRLAQPSLGSLPVV